MHVYDPGSEVLTGLNLCNLINADPLRAWFPDTPPGELTNDKMTDVPLTNLSTTPASLQMMLKLSPAVGKPGIMISGVNRLLLSPTYTTKHDDTTNISIIANSLLTSHSQYGAFTGNVLQHIQWFKCWNHSCHTGDSPVIITRYIESIDAKNITANVIVRSTGE